MKNITPLPSKEEMDALYKHFTQVDPEKGYFPPPDNIRLTVELKRTGFHIAGTKRSRWFSFDTTSTSSIGACVLAWIPHDQFLVLLQQHRAKIVS
jgi:hypothetical protein